MKPCTKNQKALSWLAIGALEEGDEAELRVHVENCSGCRQHLEKISRLAGELATAAQAVPEKKPSDLFHRQLTRRIKVESRRSLWPSFGGRLRGEKFAWSTAFAMAGTAEVLVAWFLISTSHRRPTTVEQSANPIRSVPINREVEVEQTFGSYRMLANRSLDLLDQELTAEAKKSPVNTQTYTLSSLAKVIGTD
ncbi:hypothetical protein [Pedosphaera parvula]|uniref:Zinc-finger domain-containing protein n=1 Tax=Pedosphaera parvula (strain Ellin514) TaxID=320771 RepID=B9XSK6_PEDPL|nr:hypothetical protein [Pedosphaera parvula]EEF57166.1 hypothetical protein Cflav_PD0132 [Pedosphaera parvula Ellin514]